MKDSFIFYGTFMQQIGAIKDEKLQARIIKAIINYGLYGKQPDFSDIDAAGVLQAVFVPVRCLIDADKEHYDKTVEKRRAAGRKGGAPLGNSNASKNKQNKQMVEKNKQNKQMVETDLVADKEKAAADAFAGFFNKTMREAGAAIPEIKVMSPARRAALNARVKEYGSQSVKDTIAKAARSLFLNGGGSSGFLASFDWLMRPDNFLKTMEGNYDNNRHTPMSDEERQRAARLSSYAESIKRDLDRADADLARRYGSPADSKDSNARENHA